MELSNEIREKILSGNLFYTTLILVIPIIGSHFLETAWHFLNAYWIGKLGAVSFAAVNISSFFIWIFYALISITDTGTNSLVAQMEGAGEHERAREIAHQGIIGNLILASLYALFMLLFSRKIFTLLGVEQDVVCQAYRYTSIIFSFGIPFGFIGIISAILRGYGDTRTPFISLSVGFLVTCILDPLLILGIGPFPSLGIAGGAIASDIGFFFSVLIYIVLIYRNALNFKFSWNLLKLQWRIVSRIIKIGLPPSISAIVFSLVYIFLTTIISKFGTEAMAALGIGHRIESLSFMLCLGFSYATVTLVGQNIGAGNQKRAEKAVWINVGIISAITFLIALAFCKFSNLLASLFASDAKTLDISIHYLKIISLSQVFMGVSIVLDGAFSGSGDTIPPMILSVTLTSLRVPLAYMLAIYFSMGTDGIWWAVTILCMLRGVFVTLLFSLGRWKRTRFVEELR